MDIKNILKQKYSEAQELQKFAFSSTTRTKIVDVIFHIITQDEIASSAKSSTERNDMIKILRLHFTKLAG